MRPSLAAGPGYGGFAIALHWGMAALVGGLLALGWFMVRLPDAGYDLQKITLILAHKAIGMVVLPLVAVRLAWRLRGPLPPLAETLPAWQQVAAHLAHLLFYALMLALPLTGWVMSSAGGYPVPIFGWFDLPAITRRDESLFHASIAVHRWLADALAALLAVHAGAALYHHFVLGDATLRRMLP